ncbi:MAG TPA: hypothetical protein VLL97_14800 [Acidobacteriota bacterium]|nr:hypothetical protein [Acidobacteriota bacterium]
MKKKLTASLFLFSGLLLFPLLTGELPAQGKKITVHNPLGQPPPIERVPMAPRLDTLEGKTIYIVDIGFTDTHQFFTEMRDLLSKRYPSTNWVVRTKIGTYFDDDPALWAEIKEKGHGMIMGIGH